MIRKFLYETFRPRSRRDYTEVLTRGLDGESGENYKYPWLYARVFAVLFFVFVIYAIICFVIKASFHNLTLHFAGGLFLDIALLILAFELYPFKDFSMLLLFGVALVGGTFSDLISAGIYFIFGVSNGWAVAAVAGIGEEIAKAVPTVLFIVLLKKKEQPLAGFLIGAAVGTWFSLTENAVYIAYEYESWVKILTAIGRAVSAPFSHAMWSAIIGWAFCAFKKPFINFKFYGTALLCMAMHFLCDMPLLNEFPQVLILIAACAVEATATFSFGVTIIAKERKKALPLPQEEKDRETEREKFSTSHKANLFLLGAGALFCALALVLSSVFSYKYVDEFQTKFTDAQEFISYMQNGLELSADESREYDENAENDNEVFENDVLVYCEQLVTDGQYDYYYCYRRFVTGGQGGYSEAFELTNIYVKIETDGEENFYPLVTRKIYSDETEVGLRLKYFKINDNADVIISFADGKFVFEEIVGTKKVYSPLSVALLCITCAEGVAGVAGWIIIRKRRPKSS